MTPTDYTLSRPVAISVPAEDIDKLLRSRDGTCAPVYLALQRTGGRPLQAGALGLTEQALTEALQKLAALDGNYHVLPGHGPISDLEFERANNPFLK